MLSLSHSLSSWLQFLLVVQFVPVSTGSRVQDRGVVSLERQPGLGLTQYTVSVAPTEKCHAASCHLLSEAKRNTYIMLQVSKAYVVLRAPMVVASYDMI